MTHIDGADAARTPRGSRVLEVLDLLVVVGVAIACGFAVLLYFDVV